MPEKPSYADLEQQVKALRGQVASLNEQYRSLVDNSLDAILLTVPDGRILLANPAACRLFQMTERQIIDGGRNALVDTSDPRLPSGLEERERSGRYFGELNYKKADGTRFPAQVSSVIFHNAQGEARTSMIIRDLSEAKQAEEALRESQQRFLKAFDHAPIGMALVSPAGNWLKANPALCDLLGYEEEELLGKTFQDITHPQDLAADLAQVEQMLAGAIRSYRMEKRYLHKSGHLIHALLSVSLVRDSTGQPAHFISQVVDISSLKKTEEALHRQEGTLEKIFDILPIGLWFADRDGKFLRGNRAGVAIWGAEPRVAPGDYGVFKARRLPSGEEIAPDDWALARTIREGVTVTDEMLEIDAFDGKKKIIFNYTAPILDEAGQVQGAIVVNQDITQRKQAEYALQASEAKFRGLVEQELVGFWSMDAQGITTYVNPRMAEILGYFVEEMVGRHIFSFMDQKGKALAVEYIRRRRAGIRELHEFTFRRQDGSPIVTQMATSPLRDASGQYQGAMAIVTDITEKKRLEAAVLEQKKRFEKILSEFPYGIGIVDKEHRIEYVNTCLKETFGEPGNRTCHEYFSGLSEPCPWCTNARIFSGETVHWQWHSERTDRHYEIVDIPLHNEDGTLSKIKVFQDITEKKRMEDFMVQSEKVISLGQLAAGMAHEINNPLGIISQGVQNVLRRTREPIPGNLQAAEECRVSLDGINRYLEKRNIFRSLEAIQEAVIRSAAIVATMLEFSHKSAASSTPHDLNRILEKTITLAKTDYDLKQNYDFRNIRIDTDFTLKDEVSCQPAELEQVFLNLLRNSAQELAKTRRENPTIRLRTRREKEWAVVEVEDNGSGIPREIRPKIFDPFFTTKDVGKGTGLGLAVSFHIIVQRHHGEMLVESEQGAWTRFIIHLPLTPPSADRPRDNTGLRQNASLPPEHSREKK